MKNYYTLKEVLLALRREQLKFSQKLRSLDECLNNYGDPYHEGSHFFVGNVDNTPIICYNLKVNIDVQDRRYSAFINNYIHSYCHQEQFSCEVVKRNNGNYDVSTNRVKVLKEKQEEFNKIIDEILNDEFFINSRQFIEFEDMNGNKELLTNWNSLIYSNGDKIKNLKVSPRLNYYANKDLVICDFPFENIHAKTDEVMNKLLLTKFPKEYFSSYIQKIIDSNTDLHEEILLPDDELKERHVDFALEENENQYVFKKNYYLHR